MNAIIPPSASFEFPTIAFEHDKPKALTQSLIDAHVIYGLGAKANPLSMQAGEFPRIDCSGFVRWCFYHGAGITIPDGSWVQHEWFDKNGFKVSTNPGAKDDRLRIAFLSPADGADGIGHVLLILNGICYESHGSTGPDNTRVWGSKAWMKLMHTYIVN